VTRTGVLVVHGGEPEKAGKAEVTRFLTSRARCFASVDRRLSESRVEAIAQKYVSAQLEETTRRIKKMGGSPQLAQGKKQSRLLERFLRQRGHRVLTYHAGQHSGPTIEKTLGRMRDDGIERLLTLPVFPICSLTSAIAVLDRVEHWMLREEWAVPHREVADWHRHHDYYRMHADVIRDFVHEANLNVHATDTALVFAANGSPTRFLKKGPRYQRYTQEIAKGIAREVGKKHYHLGFLNAGPVDGKWTEPKLEELIPTLDCARVVVVPIDDMVDGLSTLWGLDEQLASVANDAGVAFHRTPIPHARARFSEILADLIEDLLRPEPIMGDLNLRRCLCRGTSTGFCLNAAS
jgi:protoporphyrin/coproporphyrin ferrochelatase